MRDYHVMREVLKASAGLEHEAGYDKFKDIRAGQAEIDSELVRLIANKGMITLLAGSRKAPRSVGLGELAFSPVFRLWFSPLLDAGRI